MSRMDRFAANMRAVKAPFITRRQRVLLIDSTSGPSFTLSCIHDQNFVRKSSVEKALQEIQDTYTNISVRWTWFALAITRFRKGLLRAEELAMSGVQVRCREWSAHFSTGNAEGLLPISGDTTRSRTDVLYHVKTVQGGVSTRQAAGCRALGFSLDLKMCGASANNAWSRAMCSHYRAGLLGI